MIDLSKVVLPESVEVNGAYYPVQTDYRYGIIFFRMAQKEKSCAADYSFFFLEGMPDNTDAAVAALGAFYFPQEPLPRSNGQEGGEPVLDYELDADFIYAAFLEQYGIDLVDTRLHWHKFHALIKGLNGTKLNEIMSFRQYDAHSSDYESMMLDLKRSWSIEIPLSEEELQAVADFDALFD